MARFNITMGATDMEGNDILVFLKPENPRQDYRIHAWQVLTVPAVNGGQVCAFQYQPRFLFTVAPTPLTGQTYLTEYVDAMTGYDLPDGVGEVDVVLTREAGSWQFAFNTQ